MPLPTLQEISRQKAEDEKASRADRKCGMAIWLDSLEPNDRETADDLMSSLLSGSELARILRPFGGPHRSTLTLHRNGTCVCSKV